MGRMINELKPFRQFGIEAGGSGTRHDVLQVGLLLRQH